LASGATTLVGPVGGAANVDGMAISPAGSFAIFANGFE
jgi:hypothetical protein